MFGYEWDVQNYGVPGYTVHQGTIVIEEYALKYNPDFIITLFGVNDCRDAINNDEEYKVSISPLTQYQKYFQKLFTFKIIFYIYFKTIEDYLRKNYNTRRVPLDLYVKKYNQIFDISMKKGALWIPMTQPLNPKDINTRHYKTISEYNEALKKFCAEKKIKIIDIAAEFKEYYLKNNRNFIWDHCHPDYEGNIFISDRIIDAIKGK